MPNCFNDGVLLQRTMSSNNLVPVTPGPSTAKKKRRRRGCLHDLMIDGGVGGKRPTKRPAMEDSDPVPETPRSPQLPPPASSVDVPVKMSKVQPTRCLLEIEPFADAFCAAAKCSGCNGRMQLTFQHRNITTSAVEMALGPRSTRLT